MASDIGPHEASLARRTFLRTAGSGIGLFFVATVGGHRYVVEASASSLPGVSAPAPLAPGAIGRFSAPLLVPPAMPRSSLLAHRGRRVDYYEVSVRQFEQQVLPPGMPTTTVWGYGPVAARSPNAPLIHHAPSLTIEARWNRPVRVRWVNDLKDVDGAFVPHLLPVDQTLHWANPPGGEALRDNRSPHRQTPGPYRGPVPLVTHVHGAVGVGDESDGYPEAWYLPAARDVPRGHAKVGTWYEFFRAKAASRFGVRWAAGEVTFQYPNRQRACTLWYHDHVLGMTRLNVYAGPAGFFLIRGGPHGDAAVRDGRTGRRAVLPGPAPRENDPAEAAKAYHEIPLAIQDRSFTEDGSLFYPDTRAFFDGLTGPYLPDTDVPPIWNPEFFGNAIMVNGRTWPYAQVEQRRYRFRLLNGCNSRFLVLDFSAIPGAAVWQIGNEGGFLTEPVDLAAHGHRLLMAPAERADVIVDFTGVPLGEHVLRNVGPDEPFGGGTPGQDFEVADPDTTGQVLQFRVVPILGTDRTTPPADLVLPRVEDVPDGRRRRLALVEQMSAFFADTPVEARLGTVEGDGRWNALPWEAAVTERPEPGACEVWELHNTTEDAHPIHIHAVAFQVVDRQRLAVDEVSGRARAVGSPRPPEPGETGFKDTVVANPGEVTRVRMRFTEPGQFVWHCHIVEHEDHEMMRPMRIGPPQEGQPDR